MSEDERDYFGTMLALLLLLAGGIGICQVFLWWLS